MTKFIHSTQDTLSQCSAKELMLLQLLDCIDAQVPLFYFSKLCLPELSKDLPIFSELLDDIEDVCQTLIDTSLIVLVDDELSLPLPVRRQLRQGKYSLTADQRDTWCYFLCDFNLTYSEKIREQSKEQQDEAEEQKLNELADIFLHHACDLCQEQSDWEIITQVLIQLDTQYQHDVHDAIIKKLATTILYRAEAEKKNLDQERYTFVIDETVQLLYDANACTTLLEWYQQQIEATDDQQTIGSHLHVMGMLSEKEEQWQQAIDYYKQSIQAKRASGVDRTVSLGFGRIACIYHLREKWKEALNYYNQAIAVSKTEGDDNQTADYLFCVGHMYQLQHKWSQAHDYINQALTIFRASSVNSYEEGDCLYHIGMVYRGQEQWQPALDHYKQAIETYRAADMEQETGSCFGEMGAILVMMEKYQEAIACALDALECFLKHPYYPEYLTTSFAMVRDLQDNVAPEVWRLRFGILKKKYPTELSNLEQAYNLD